MLGLVSLVHIAKQRKEDASVAAEPSTVALTSVSKVLIDHLTLASTSAASGARIFSPAKIDTTWPASGAAHTPLAGLFNRQLLCDRGKQFLYVLWGLCGGLEEEKVGFSGVCLGVGDGYGALVGLFSDKIGFVSCKSDDNVLVGLALEFLYPCLGLV
jgi:hypothetical protein